MIGAEPMSTKIVPFLAVAACVAASHLAVAQSANVSFREDVQPILRRSCQGCHQPASKMSGLDVTTYAALVAGGKKGSALAAGEPDASLLLGYVSGVQQPRMPLGQPALPDEQIAVLRSWIAEGAKDDSTPVEMADANKPPTYHQAPVVAALTFSPDGKTLAVAGYREVVLHKADGSKRQARLVGSAEKILSLVFTPDGTKLIAAGGTPARFGEVQVWDTATHKLTSKIRACGDTIFGASVSPDGTRVAFGCPDQTTRIHDIATGEELHKSSYHENWVLGTAFGLDGKRLVSVGRDSAARVADTASGAFLETVNKLRGELAALARHPLRDTVVIGGEDRVPYYYRMQRTKKMNIADDTTLIREFERQDGEIFALAFHPAGTYIAVAGASPEVAIYELDSGDKKSALTGHEAGIYTLAFDPSGERIATAGFDGQVRIYDSSSGKLVKEFTPVPLSGKS